MNHKLLKKISLFLLGILLLLFVFSQIKSNQKTSSTLNEDQLEQLAKPLAEVNINRNFDFSIKDPQGKPIILKYGLVSAKKVKLIATKGEPIKSPAGKEFLILSLDLQNDSKYPLKVNSQDFVRLIGNDNKKYAPDFYNGSLDVPAISVKKDEMAFIVEEKINQFKLSVGEIDKEKTEVEINF